MGGTHQPQMSFCASFGFASKPGRWVVPYNQSIRMDRVVSYARVRIGRLLMPGHASSVLGKGSIHHSFAHILARHNAIFFSGKVFVHIGEELEDFLYFVFFFGGDVVLLCELGARTSGGGGGGGGGASWSSAPLRRLVR